MKKLIFSFSPVFIITLLVFPIFVFAQNYIQSFDNGKIDWTNGIAEAVGLGIPQEKYNNQAQARALAKREAIRVARKNLLAIIKRIQINSESVIEDFIVKRDMIIKKVQNLLVDAQVVDIKYMSDGSVEATVDIKLVGPFADIILPRNIRIIEQMQYIRSAHNEGKVSFTGLVVDCRGFSVKPALVPRIIDEDGGEVYSPVYISREYAIKKGIAGYARDLTTAQNNPRVAGRPLIMKGIKTAKTGKSDIVISNADAAKIKGNACHLNFLQKCRVMIVLD